MCKRRAAMLPLLTRTVRRRVLKRPFVLAAAAAAGLLVTTPAAQDAGRFYPLAVLEPAPAIQFPSSPDSNSPLLWFFFKGVQRLVLFNTSSEPVTTISVGRSLTGMQIARTAAFSDRSGARRWIEAVVADDGGTLYGYYHHEPSDICPDPELTAPRIGAARSFDGGRTWEDLGIVLEAPPDSVDCDTPNRYFAGGVGDFSVILDRNGYDLYFLFSSYHADVRRQGVAAARMRWSDRDAPGGQVAVWDDVWRYPDAGGDGLVYPPAAPILSAGHSWHGQDRIVDAWWGPSVHWNTFLNRYVILLNRARDVDWTQEGIYISWTETIENPGSWAVPQKLVDGGSWYPQVVGLEPGSGTDKLAGERARFFAGGASSHEIVFLRRGVQAVPRP